MSLSASVSTKKRKTHDDAGQASGSSSSKKSKRDKKDTTQKRDKKGKSRASETEGEFRVIKTSLMVSIPPIFANNPMAGVEEMLDSLVMRYVPALRGVVLCHANIHFLTTTAAIKMDCPFANCVVGFDATIWSPQVGMKLNGRVNLCSPDHISLLVHRTFNVSIPRHHILTDHWEFEYGPAENDPEYGPDATEAQGGEPKPVSDPENVDDVAEEAHNNVEGEGKWIHKITGDKIGGPDGVLEFTVIGLTIANQMLSLVGSLQPDPFSEVHVAQPAVLSSVRPANADDDAPPQLDEESEDDDDTFAALGRLGDKAEAERRAKMDAESKSEKKRKRKEKEPVPGEEGYERAKEKAEKKAKKKAKKESHQH